MQPQPFQQPQHRGNHSDYAYNRNLDLPYSLNNVGALNTYQPPITGQNPVLPPFIVTPDSNLISTSTGLPIAGPQFQDSNLYVIHLPKEYTDNDLYELFEKYGKITSSRVITYQPEEIEQLNRKKKREAVKHASSTSIAVSTFKDEDSKQKSAITQGENSDGSNDDSGNDSPNESAHIPVVGESKCFGFVCFQNPIDASKALVCMNGYKVDSSHVLRVTFAQRKENKYNQGRLHHYNQNHLGGLYQYVNNYNNTYAHMMATGGTIPPVPVSSQSIPPMGAMPSVGMGPMPHLGPMAQIPQINAMPPTSLPPSPSSSLPGVSMQHNHSLPSMPRPSNFQNPTGMGIIHGVPVVNSSQHQPHYYYHQQQQQQQFQQQSSPPQTAIPTMNNARLSGVPMMSNAPSMNKYNNWFYPNSYYQNGSNRERFEDYEQRQILDTANGLQDLVIGISDDDEYESYGDYDDYEACDEYGNVGDERNIETEGDVNREESAAITKRGERSGRRGREGGDDDRVNTFSNSNTLNSRSRHTRFNSHNSHNRRNYSTGSSNGIEMNQSGYYNYNYYDHNYSNYGYNRGNYRQHNRSHSMINPEGFGPQRRQDRRE